MKSYIAYPTEQQARIMIAFFKALDISYEQVVSDALPPGVLENIQRGQEDIAAGRTVSLEEFKKRLSSAK
ncbi:hypothetical protein ACFGVS_11215 [Mucilaginibacter sp. AW1-7]|uniref:hypothetical protein n=1 Tax=unclassified Mucilaginibacter TaxID=2617802 RepID=UPI0023653032|nr:hypothetical protein [Mucilaginibacter sp. KACC 22773]WDF79836.1 hypothetical protein PQ469_07425 [Mucilaginibacter sp. KACC 22773]